MILRWLSLRVPVNAPEDTTVWFFHLNKLHRLSRCVLGFFQLPSPLLFPLVSSYHLTTSPTDSWSSTVVSIFKVIRPRILLSLWYRMLCPLQSSSSPAVGQLQPFQRPEQGQGWCIALCSGTGQGQLRVLKQETVFLPLHTVCQISRGCHRNPVGMSETVCKENIRSGYYSVHLALQINFPQDLFQALAVHKIEVIGIQKSIANHQELGQVRSCQSR